MKLSLPGKETDFEKAAIWLLYIRAVPASAYPCFSIIFAAFKTGCLLRKIPPGVPKIPNKIARAAFLSRSQDTDWLKTEKLKGVPKRLRIFVVFWMFVW